MLDNLSLLLAKALGFCLLLLVGGGLLLITIDLLTHHSEPAAGLAFKAAHHTPAGPRTLPR